jgi:hypothetical protein
MIFGVSSYTQGKVVKNFGNSTVLVLYQYVQLKNWQMIKSSLKLVLKKNCIISSTWFT